ncbi:stage III sporulation protein AH [Eisenbergiella tayi]|uniref:Stage III sporulation protein AH n=1 Tax=Eisenbergiella tayi TaxID=1432052 RepID=A0A1E3UJW5_9FIRM|nr:SpoIIIAH-like family protein [Eisenbergiella tayi]ODR34724.1 stage III sporulation protein AH [Eisenbergiella tayi]ODR42763.1 stage III sporulation protein AH [Eisenbergiella tayi]ODR51800.1 stage III sporulation protein AH [Eisenbergiella tayi]ODR56518.1 stage III sporulation protein AH [Eisenbergiella tayi]ODR62161.1 stage III sporulation protein AH [Eisenbergiella tayi]
MKNVLKRNQIMITALAIMIAVAGYLNFAGTKAGEEQLTSADAGNAGEDMTALLDLSEEDVVSDIDSMDSDQDGVAAADYLNEQMPANAQVQADSAQVAVVSETMDEASAEQVAEDTDVQNGEVPGEAVFTSSTGVTSLAGAKLQKEQTRAKNKETLLDIINNANISEEQKQDAINGMIALTDMAEKETAAEILLEAKGFNDVVVSISGSGVDVVVNAPSLTDAQRAQIEDIVTRKTGISPENIIISPITGN